MFKVLTSVLIFTALFAFSPSLVKASEYYVSKNGDNSSGTSWTSAWNELDQIDWSVVQPGDTIYIDGGSERCLSPQSDWPLDHVSNRSLTCGMRYNSTLTIGKSGTPSAPINIKLSSEAGKNGTVVIFGGRNTPLPYCGQSSYIYQTEGVRQTGVYIDKSYINIDGNNWSGFIIYGHSRFGLRLRSSATNITVSNVEIYDNGIAYQENGRWYPDLPGIDLAGNNLIFNKILVHDNGQDGFQGKTTDNFTLTNSWLYHSRKHPSADESFNQCRHPDGIQLFGSSSNPISNNLLIENSVIGPGFMQGLLLGGNDGTQENTTQDVVIRDTLLMKASNANLSSHSPEVNKPSNWKLERVTSYIKENTNSHDQNNQWHNLQIEGNNHEIIDSIVYGGLSITMLDSDPLVSGNCQFAVGGKDIGTTADPQFTSVNHNEWMSFNDNFTVQNTSCEGSSVTSVADLLSSNGTTPTNSEPPLMNELTFEAEDGLLQGLVSENGYIYQNSQITNPESSGKAKYRFNIQNSGEYKVKLLLKAEDGSSNSLYVTIDNESELSEPSTVWDIQTTGNLFEEREVSWRGNSEDLLNPEISPKTFNLSEGEHTLIIAGREAGTQVDKVYIENISTAEDCNEFPKGDINEDCKVDTLDLLELLNIIFS